MWVASTVVVGAAILVLGLNFWIVFSEVVNVRGVEPNVLHSVQKLLAHEELYADPAAAPFDIVQYTPLYYYAVAGLARATEISAGDVGRLYVLARLMSISFLIASLLVAQALVMALARGARLAAIVSCAALAIVTSPWQALARPDAMTAFLLMVMLYAVVRSFSARWLMWLLIASIAGAGAAGAKQNGLFGVVAVALYFAGCGAWRSFWVFSSSVAAWLIAGAAVAFGLFGSHHLISNVVDGLDNGVSVGAAWRNTYEPFLSYFAVLLVVTTLAAMRHLRALTLGGRPFLALYCATVFVLSTIAALKVGSAVNYYNDFLWAAVPFLTIELWGALRQPALPAPPVLLGGCLYAIVVVVTITSHHVDSYWLSIRGDRLATREDLVGRLRTELASCPNSYLVSFDQAVALLLHDQTLAPQTELAVIQHQRGIVDYAAFKRMVTAGRVDLLVVRAKPTRFLGVDFSAARLVAVVDGWQVFKPATSHCQ
jgi:hypothetical protein